MTLMPGGKTAGGAIGFRGPFGHERISFGNCNTHSKTLPPEWKDGKGGRHQCKGDEVQLVFSHPSLVLSCIPPDFVLITNHHSHCVHRLVFCAVSAHTEAKSSACEFGLDLDDPQNQFEKFARLLRGERVNFVRAEGDFYRAAVTALSAEAAFPLFNHQLSCGVLTRGSMQKMPKTLDLCMIPRGLRRAAAQPEELTFTICTPNGRFPLSKFAFFASPVLLSLLESDPGLSEIQLDSDDLDIKVFADLFSFRRIHVTHANVDFLHEIGQTFDVAQLLAVTARFLEGTAHAQEQLESGLSETLELQNVLLGLARGRTEMAVAAVREGPWLDSREGVRHVLLSAFSVVRGRPELSPAVAKFLRSFYNQNKQRESMALFIHFLETKVLRDRPGGGYFAFQLVEQGLLDFSAIVRRYRAKFVRNIGCAMPANASTLNARDFFVWFIPELSTTFPKIVLLLNPGSFFALAGSRAPSVDGKSEVSDEMGRITQYRKDDWKLFRECRRTAAGPDEFARVIRADDVPSLQAELAKVNFNYDREIPGSLFEGCPRMPLLSYACRRHAINCVRFLLMNGARVSAASLQAAVSSGNSEIIRLIDARVKPAVAGPPLGGPRAAVAQADQEGDLVALAVQGLHADVCGWLLENGRGSNEDDAVEQYAALAAVCVSLGCFSLLLERGLPLRWNVVTPSFHKSFMAFARSGFAAVMELMLNLLDEKSTYPDEVAFSVPNLPIPPKSLLANAARSGSLRTVECILQSDKLKLKMALFPLALKFAAKHGNLEIFECIRQDTRCHPYPTLFDECLAAAVLGNHADMVDYLTPLVGDVAPAMISACRVDDIDVARTLAARLPKDFDATSLFPPAILSASERVLDWLLGTYPDANFTNICGHLIEAGISGSTRIVELVLTRIPENEAKEIAEQSLQRAIEANCADFVRLLSNFAPFWSKLLCLAVQTSNLDIVKTLVAKNSSEEFLNAVDPQLGTPLCVAAQSSNPDVGLFLLSLENIKPSVHDQYLRTPLVYAARHANLPIVQAIINFYGDSIGEHINEVNHAVRYAMRGFPNASVGGFTYAVRDTGAGRVSVILFLLTVPGVDVNCIDKNENLFLFAVRSGSLDLIDALLAFPAVNVNEYNQRGTALHAAILESSPDVCSRLLNCDRIDLCFRAAATPLSLAVQKGNLEVVKSIVAKNQSRDVLNAIDPQNGPPLCAAIQSCKPDIVKFLLTLPNIDPTLHDHALRTPLVLAARQGNIALVQAIVEFPGMRQRIPDINQALRHAMRDSLPPVVQQPALRAGPGRFGMAFARGPAIPVIDVNSRVSVICYLLMVPGVDVNSASKTESLLLFAARVGAGALVEALLKFPELNVNEYNCRGTALQSAMTGGFRDIALRLIECDRVDLNYGGASLDAAVKGGVGDIVRALIESPRFDPARHDLTSVLKLAIEQSKVELAMTLLESRLCAVLLEPNSVLAILRAACSGDHLPIVEFIVRRFEDDVNLVIENQSLLSIAVTGAATSVVRFIVSSPTFDPARTDAMAIFQLALRHSLQATHCLAEALELPGVDVNAPFADGSTALTQVARERDPNVLGRTLDILLRVPGIDVNRRDAMGRTLVTQLLKREVQLAPSILGHGDIDWNLPDATTLDTPLIIVARQKQQVKHRGFSFGHGKGSLDHPIGPVLRMLLGRPDVDVNAQNSQGNTALIEAVVSRNVGAIKAIAGRKDCRLNIANTAGETVFSLAGCQPHEQAIKNVVAAVIALIKEEMPVGFAGNSMDPAFAPGRSDTGGFGPGAFGQGAFGPGAFGQGAFGQGAFGQGAFGQGAFGQRGFGPPAVQGPVQRTSAFSMSGLAQGQLQAAVGAMKAPDEAAASGDETTQQAGPGTDVRERAGQRPALNSSQTDETSSAE